jgi:hypothetical protein
MQNHGRIEYCEESQLIEATDRENEFDSIRLKCAGDLNDIDADEFVIRNINQKCIFKNKSIIPAFNLA